MMCTYERTRPKQKILGHIAFVRSHFGEEFFICVTVFFWHGSAWHASGCQKGAADEPLRGSLNFKP